MADDNKLKFLEFREHVLLRTSTWVGSNVLGDQKFWVIEDGKFIYKSLNITLCLYKIFDEIIVNAVDQYTRTAGLVKNGGAVSKISVKFDKETGEIEVYNNGQGIEIYIEDKIGVYTVEGLITKSYSGSNFDDSNENRISSGTNGIGMKCVAILSKKFTIETVDLKRRIKYYQEFSDNLSIINKPKITKINNDANSFTRIKFTPDYAKICRIDKKNENHDWINEKNLKDFEQNIITRLYQTAVYISTINFNYMNSNKVEFKKKAKVYFNNEEIKVKSLEDFVKLFGITQSIYFILNPPENEYQYPWHICVGYTDNKELSGLGMSIINSTFLSKGGTHISFLHTQIKNALKEKILSLISDTSIEFKDSMLRKLLFIIDIKQIPLSLANFGGGNIKDSITMGLKEINKMKKIYVIDDKIISKIWLMVKDILEYKIQKQDFVKSTKKQHTKKIRKYEPAKHRGIKSILFIPEGDSAEKAVRDMLTYKKTQISIDYCGRYNIQGVPPNVCKKTKEILIDGEVKIKQDRDLQKNIAFQGLVAAMNLNYNYTYYYGDDEEKLAQGNKEFATLNYGTIIITTDQDLDGIGNICSLIIVFILLFWPDLIKRKVVKRMQTPLIRVYMPSHQVIEFYSTAEYQEWIKKNYGTDENMPDNIKNKVRYYKGLGGHTPEEIHNMSQNIKKNILTLTWDDAVKIKMKMFYGEDTTNRKEILLTPVSAVYNQKMFSKLEIPISTHFDIESKSFQLYFMRRKLKSAIDGFVPSQRKAFAGIRKMKLAIYKVYQITGRISHSMQYPHGDVSMNETIIKMAQNFTGSNNIPTLMAISNGFGGRELGRKKGCASPRYIDSKYNHKVMDLIFPPEDDWLLEYVYEDGHQAEPKFYIPIIPYSILETTTTTGVGWKISVWARDYHWTMQLLRDMIKNSTEPHDFFGKAWIPENMSITILNNKETCKGYYILDEEKETVHITQLPLKIWSYPFKCNLLGINHKTGNTEDKEGNPISSKEYVDDVYDNTGNDQNDIIVKFKKGTVSKILEDYGNHILDPIESYLGLYQIMTPNLNMFCAEDTIKEFKSYEEVMSYWFYLRRELYIKRRERQLIILELLILYYQEILRFIYMDEKKEINIDKKDKEEREKILANYKFIRFNKTNLLSPKYIKCDELRKYILEYGASYKYIYDINKAMTENTAIANLEKNKKEKERELEEIKNKDWKTIWLDELDVLDPLIELGIKTKWLFDEVQHEFKSYRSSNEKIKSKTKVKQK